VKTYLVGGAVRDELLGLPVQDRDYVVVGATEPQLLDLGYRRMDVAFPVFLHPDSGDEYALARRERKTGPGYKGFAVDAGPDVTLEEDLARRDLTINAMARDASGSLIDPFHGEDDLRQGFLRHITPAFTEDPVRLLRTARFAAYLGRWGFRLAHPTHAVMKRMAGFGELATVVPERLREEMTKALKSDQPWRFFEVLQACGALATLLPPLAAAIGTAAGHGRQAAPGPLRALRCAADLDPDPAERLAVLLAALPDGAAAGTLAAGLGLDRATLELLDRLVAWPARWVATAGPEHLLGLLDGIKAWHHPGRVAQLQRCWQCLGVDEQAADRPARALRAAARINAQDLVAAGLRGPEVGTELRRRRLAAIVEGMAHD